MASLREPKRSKEAQRSCSGFFRLLWKEPGKPEELLLNPHLLWLLLKVLNLLLARAAALLCSTHSDSVLESDSPVFSPPPPNHHTYMYIIYHICTSGLAKTLLLSIDMLSSIVSYCKLLYHLLIEATLFKVTQFVIHFLESLFILDFWTL